MQETSYLCIAPVCGDSCSLCASAISPRLEREYAIRYAFLRTAPLGVFGVPCIALPSGNQSGHFANGVDADEAVDAAMNTRPG